MGIRRGARRASVSHDAQDDDRVDVLAEAFAAAGYEVTVLAEPNERPHLILVRGKGDQIDVLLPVVEYQRVALERAVDHVITVEDVIIHKLIAWEVLDRWREAVAAR